MNVAENSSNEFQLVEQCNPQNEEMEICAEGDGRDRPLSTGNPLNCHFAAELHAKPGGIYKSSNDNANAPQSVSNSFSLEPSKSDSFKCKNIISIEPLKRPPSSEELLNSLKDYGLPQCRYQRPFCSDPDDVPSCPRLVTRVSLYFQRFQWLAEEIYWMSSARRITPGVNSFQNSYCTWINSHQKPCEILVRTLTNKKVSINYVSFFFFFSGK